MTEIPCAVTILRYLPPRDRRRPARPSSGWNTAHLTVRGRVPEIHASHSHYFPEPLATVNGRLVLVAAVNAAGGRGATLIASSQ